MITEILTYFLNARRTVKQDEHVPATDVLTVTREVVAQERANALLDAFEKRATTQAEILTGIKEAITRATTSTDFAAQLTALQAQVDALAKGMVQQFLNPPQYVKFGLPDASANKGAFFYCLDDIDGECLAYSNGSTWNRVYDNAVLS